MAPKRKLVKMLLVRFPPRFPVSCLSNQTAESVMANNAPPPAPSESPSASTSSAPATSSKDAQDFFSAIEEEQPTILNPQTNRSVLPSCVRHLLNTCQSQYGLFPTTSSESLHTNAGCSINWLHFATGYGCTSSAKSFQ